MRPELSVYGHEYMKTPNFQALADDGFFFRRSYVQYALCAPSRTVLLTGRRPDTSRVWAIGPYFRETTGRNWTTLPQMFKQHGYRAIGHGKIFHEGNASGFPLDQDQAFGSWSVPYYHTSDQYNHYNKTHPSPEPGKVKTPLSNEGIDAPWQTFNDARSALTAVEWIRNASAYEEPFFLAVGFHRPHIPYVYPKQFEFEGDVRFPPSNYRITKDVPTVAPHDWTGEGNGYGDLHALRPPITNHTFQKNLSSLCAAVPLAKQAEMKRSYYSCIQYIDHLVGVLVGALKDEGLYDDTTIIFWGDHGYKLGEHCDWFKHDNYEDATRIPVVLKPAVAGAGANTSAAAVGPRGRPVEQLVEEVDIFPSLLELAGISVPRELQGASWVPLLQAGGARAAGKPAVFSQYTHFNSGKDPRWPNKTKAMGYSMRTNRWRYTEWLAFDCGDIVGDPMKQCADKSKIHPRYGFNVGTELYDHEGDGADQFDQFENENLAYRADHADVVRQLHQQLVASWAPPEE
eukprot:g726.t1